MNIEIYVYFIIHILNISKNNNKVLYKFYISQEILKKGKSGKLNLWR